MPVNKQQLTETPTTSGTTSTPQAVKDLGLMEAEKIREDFDRLENLRGMVRRYLADLWPSYTVVTISVYRTDRDGAQVNIDVMYNQNTTYRKEATREEGVET